MTAGNPVGCTATDKEIRNRFAEALGLEVFKPDEPMSKHTTFKTGGPADYYIAPATAAEISDALKICAEYGIEYHIIGNGSNLIVKDKGVRGAVIQLRERFGRCIINKDDVIEAEAGALLPEIAAFALSKSLSGFEFATGIPGTAGGAVSMNAGAYGGEMKDVVLKTVYMQPEDGTIREISGEGHRFGYRTSFVQESGAVVLKVYLGLRKADKASITALMEEYRTRRKEKQPLEYPSAGSIFKSRIKDGVYAWQLIDGCGLRGLKSGGAQISEKHCGFIINRDGASAKDVLNLINIITEKVRDRYNLEMSTEVRIIGEE